MDSQGTLIIHPQLEGTNIYHSIDSTGRMFIKEICERKNGKIIYPWQNPDEPDPREKLVLFNYIPELDWIVASSSYLEEFYHPLKTIGYATLVMAAIMLVIIVPLTWWINGSIARPLRSLMEAFSKGAAGDSSGRIALSGGMEIRQLATDYNRFMDRLEESRQRLKQSEEKYRSIFENAVEGIFQTTLEGRFISANPSMAATLGYGSPEKLVANIQDVKHQLYVNPNHREELLQALKKRGMVYGFQTQLFRRDGSKIWVSINARAVKDDSDHFQFIEGLLSDISERKEAETKLQQAKAELEKRVQDRTAQLSNWVKDLRRRNKESRLLSEMGDLIQVCRTTDETFPVIESHLKRLFPHDMLCLFSVSGGEKTFEPVLCTPKLPHSPFEKDDCWAIRQGKPFFSNEAEYPLACAHLGQTPRNGYLCAPLTAQGEHIGLLHIQFGSHDKDPIMEKQQKQPLRLAAAIADHLALSLANLKLRETLRFQSIQDPLTGLFNRRYMEEVLNGELARIKRQKSSMVIIMLDVDHFKKLNDTYGHDLGDTVLRKLGQYIRKRVRTEDIPCRYGGEEFALILTDIPMDSALAKAKEIHSGIANTLMIQHHDRVLSITVSMGIAAYPNHGNNADDILQAADAALYQAKEAGRNCVVAAT
jgi:diguanylate cyclase (GGDEF)-like protein/PAS domain S-box-containing protein